MILIDIRMLIVSLHNLYDYIIIENNIVHSSNVPHDYLYSTTYRDNKKAYLQPMGK